MASTGYAAPEFVRLTMSVRPTRVVVLVDVDDKSLFHTARRLSENFSAVWGGVGNVVLPRVDGKINDAFWRVLEAHDPDRVGYFRPTRKAQKMASPAAYEEWVENQLTALSKQWDRTRSEVEEIFKNSQDQLLDSDLPWPNLSDDLKAFISNHLGGFVEGDGDPFTLHFAADDIPGHALAPMGKVAGLEDRPIFSVHLSHLDDVLALPLLFRVGAIAPTYQGELATRGVVTPEVAMTADYLDDILDLTWNKQISDADRATRRRRMQEQGRDEVSWHRNGFLDETPLGRTQLGCSWFYSPIGWRGIEHPRTYRVVLGDHPNDFFFWLALDRVVGNSYWIPRSLLESSDEMHRRAKNQMADRLAHIMGYGHSQDAQIQLTSLSMSMDELSVAFSELQASTTVAESLPNADVVLPTEVSLRKPLTLYDSERHGIATYEPFFRSVLASELTTPTPSTVQGLDVLDISWQVDVLIDNSIFPPRSALNELFSHDDVFTREYVRASHSGVSYWSKSMGFVMAGARLEDTLARPRLRKPDDAELFRKLVARAGLRLETSQAGRYAKGLLDLWQGLDAFLTDWRSPAVNALLLQYLKPRDVAPSSRTTGIYLGTLRRRFLSFEAAVHTASASREEVRSILDRFTLLGIMRRGFIFKCLICGYDGWFRLEDVGQTFRCPRCRSDNPILPEAWRDPAPDDPYWYYELDEIAYQALDNNVHAPLLVLDKLRQRTTSFFYVSEVDLWKGDALLGEIDICAIADGRIFLGEAKTVDTLGRPDEKERQAMRELVEAAEAATAHEIVLATTVKWSPKTWTIAEEESSKGPASLRWLEELA